MPGFPIALVNAAGFPAGELEAFLPVLDIYFGQWLAPFWPEVQTTTFEVWQDDQPPLDRAALVFTPTISAANSLGYHEETESGLPLGFVELDAIKENGLPDNWMWVTATHELAEMAINPALDQYAAVGDRWYPKEVADPVTGDTFLIQGYPVSNAATPAFFLPGSPAGRRMDLMALVHQPLPHIPKNGWLEWNEAGEWQSAWGEELPPEFIEFAQRTGRHRRTRLKEKFQPPMP